MEPAASVWISGLSLIDAEIIIGGRHPLFPSRLFCGHSSCLMPVGVLFQPFSIDTLCLCISSFFLFASSFVYLRSSICFNPRSCLNENMSSCQVMEANSPTLKRSFDTTRHSNLDEHFASRKRSSDDKTVDVRSAAIPCYRIPRATKRKSILPFCSLAMPVQTTAPAPAAFPSFMSVFGGGMESLRDNVREETSSDDLGSGTHLLAEKSFQTHYPPPTPYQHREIAASADSDSTNSSPTTTVSTFGSPSVTDPSPSSSPESPILLLPMLPFKNMMETPTQCDKAAESVQPSNFFPSQPRSESPASKERNVKNLSLNMNLPNARPATSSALEGLHAFSAPTSPLRGTMKNGRRKPNNLTIQTPGFEKTTFSASDIPPTPSHRPALKHHESSPALPSLLSPTTAPLGGMHFPPISMNRLISRPGSQSSFSSLSVSSQGLHDLREDASEVNEPLKSQEVKERGYPDGPVMIYESGVYLFLEPSREEASKFDTVINVAKEVANPFSSPAAASNHSVMSVWRSAEYLDTPEPRTAVSDISFKSALEWPHTAGLASPVTPKPKATEPEYIHVPWDHNSEILDDLYSLCQIIENRVSNGKNVLIHCQLGVSRSASLVIAYGLFKGFKSDFHSMYTFVKERSQWVGPNMSLIYQLMDFRTKVSSGEFIVASKPPPPDWFQSSSTDNEMTPRPLPVLSSLSIAAPTGPDASEPLWALTGSKSSPNIFGLHPSVPSCSEVQSTTRKVSLPTALSNIAMTSPVTESLEMSSLVSPPAPLDAPPIPPRSAKRSAPRPLLLRERACPLVEPVEIPPHTPRDRPFPMQTASYAPVKMDLMMQNAPPTPSIFSPRITEFRTLSLNATNAGDLVTQSSEKKSNKSKRLTFSRKLKRL